MIKVENIRKNFDNLSILKGINLEIQQSAIISILGASGAGKTTLLQIMGSILEPTSGKVFINGTDIFALSANRLAEFRNKNIGFIFQFHHLLSEFTALENICFPAFIAKKTKKECEKQALELPKIMNNKARKNHKPNELSGGEKQRIAIARSLINNPLVIFADEPSGNLDSKNASDLYNIIFDLRTHYKQTFVIVTHNDAHAQLTDHVFTIKDGQIE
jgi:lipoprotein-releasing system ATP-binding protein